jgi:hypothetical protein
MGAILQMVDSDWLAAWGTQTKLLAYGRLLALLQHEESHNRVWGCVSTACAATNLTSIDNFCIIS